MLDEKISDKLTDYTDFLLLMFTNQLDAFNSPTQGCFQALFYYRYTVVNTQSSIEF